MDEQSTRRYIGALSNLDREGVFRLNLGVSWVCVLNPSDATVMEIRPLIDEAYRIAVRRNSGR